MSRARITRHRDTFMFVLAYGAIAASLFFVYPASSGTQPPATQVASEAR